MKQYMKHILIVIIGIFLCTFLVGCNKNSSVSIIEGDENPLGKYEDEIDVSTVLINDAILNELVLSYYPNESIKNNRFTELYKDRLNINLYYSWIANSDDEYTDKINLAMASDSLPDIFQVDAAQMQILAEDGQIQDLSEIWDKYATELLKEVVGDVNDPVFKSYTYDGKVYAIPKSRSAYDTVQFAWIRMDWLKKLVENKPELGLTTNPTTYDDFIKIVKAFKDYSTYLNGKTINGAYGIAFQQDFFNDMGGIHGFMNMFGAYPSIWVEKSDGTLEYGGIQSEVKDALSALRDLYSEGYIISDFATRNSESIASDLVSNKVGVVFGQQWLAGYPFNTAYLANNNVEWVAFPLFNKDGKTTKAQISSGNFSGWCVSKNCQHPEALIKLLNCYVESIWGETGDFSEYYLTNEYGAAVWGLSAFTPEPRTKNLDAYRAIKKAVLEDKTDFLTGEPAQIWSYIEKYKRGDGQFWNWYVTYDPIEDSGTYDAVFEVMDYYDKNNLFIQEKFIAAPTESMVLYSATMNQKRDEAYISIIKGTASLDSFESMVNTWYKIGGTQITKEVNDWYKNNK